MYSGTRVSTYRIVECHSNALVFMKALQTRHHLDLLPRHSQAVEFAPDRLVVHTVVREDTYATYGIARRLSSRRIA